MLEVSLVKFSSGGCNWTLLMIRSTLVQVMAWCRHTPSHYLSQCWPRSMLPYGVTRPQHSFSQSPVILCFALAIMLFAHPKITTILSFSWGFPSKVAFCTPWSFICTPWVAISGLIYGPQWVNCQRWFRVPRQVTNHSLKQWWPSLLMHICVTQA